MCSKLALTGCERGSQGPDDYILPGGTNAMRPWPGLGFGWPPQGGATGGERPSAIDSGWAMPNVALRAYQGEEDMLHVVAIVTAKPGMRDAILKEFHANMPAVHAEPGCIEYGPAVDADGIGALQTRFGPDAFAVIEKWESLAAFKAHAAAPHMAAYAAKTKEMIASRVIHVLSPG